LKYLLYVLIALVVIAIILGLVGPKTFDFHRTAVVSGTPEQVWPYVSNLKNMQLWSPWAEKDTAMSVEYTGTDGAVGSMISWSGNKDVGKGSQTISLLEPNTHVESTLKFMEPMENEATSYTYLSDTTGGTLVKWGIRGENGFIGRIFASVMNFDKMMAPDFERGLAKLTELMASAPKTAAAPAVNIVPGDYPGGKYFGIRGTMKMTELESFYEKSYAAIFPALEKAGGKPAGMPLGLYYKWDMATGTTELVAGVAFTGDAKAPKGMEVVNVAPGRSLTINYMGGYHGIGAAHEAMDAYIQQNKLEHIAPVIEEYITDPGSEPDSNKWVTKILYLVK
jgi:effector-binding domain-containing protein